MTQALQQSLLKPGDVGTVQVQRLNDDGDGVGQLNGWTVFIPRALPGEAVQVRVRAVHRRHAEAVLVDSPADRLANQPAGAGNAVDSLRTAPLCGIFDQCGGCQLQHIAYAAQLEHKRSVVQNAFQRIGRFDSLEVQPTLGMEWPWRYRNQIQVALSWDEKTGMLVPGFFAAKSHRIVPALDCQLVPEAVERTMLTAPRIIAEVLGTEARLVHHLIIRHSTSSNEQMVVLCVQRTPQRLRAACERLAAGPVVSVAVTVQPQATGPVWGKRVDVVCGQVELREQLGDVEFLVSPRSFFQVNTRQAGVLTQIVQRMARLEGHETLLDAYCGTGTFSLTMAHKVAKTIGVDSVDPAIRDARRNAKHNAIANAEFVVGEAETFVPQAVSNQQRFDVAVLDPPRKGCHPDVLNALLEAEIPRLVYVSCNPATLARDLRILVDGGYQVEEVQPVDMFPQTSHVECCVSLVRKLR